MKPLEQLAKDAGLADGELIPMGRQLGKIDYMRVVKRLKDRSINLPLSLSRNSGEA